MTTRHHSFARARLLSAGLAVLTACTLSLTAGAAHATGNADFTGTWAPSPGLGWTITSQDQSGACTGTSADANFTLSDCHVSGTSYFFDVSQGSYVSHNAGTLNGNTLTGTFNDGSSHPYTATRTAAGPGITGQAPDPTVTASRPHVRGSHVSVPFSCGAGSCVVQSVMSTVVTVKGGSGPARKAVVRIGRGQATAAGGQRGSVQVRLNHRGRTVLRHARHLRALVVTTSGGAVLSRSRVRLQVTGRHGTGRTAAARRSGTRISVTGFTVNTFDSAYAVPNGGTYTETCAQNDPVIGLDVSITGHRVRKHAAYAWRATYNGTVVAAYREHWTKNGTQSAAFSADNAIGDYGLDRSGRLSVIFMVGHRTVARGHLDLVVPSSCS